MKVGDRVVCVKGHPSPECSLKKGVEYTILNTNACSCGGITIDVGVPLPLNLFSGCYCKKIINGSVWWLDPNLFRPISYNSAMDELLNKEIVEEKADIQIKEPQKS